MDINKAIRRWLITVIVLGVIMIGLIVFTDFLTWGQVGAEMICEQSGITGVSCYSVPDEPEPSCAEKWAKWDDNINFITTYMKDPKEFIQYPLPDLVLANTIPNCPRPEPECWWEWKEIEGSRIALDETCLGPVDHYDSETLPVLFRKVLKENPGWEIMQFKEWRMGVERNKSTCSSAIQIIDFWLRRQVCEEPK